MSKLHRGALVVVGSMVALVAALPIASAAPMSGAIFTTGAGCTAVNLNGYELNADVYLSGGPSQPDAASLPDGSYWVKVTEPSGAVLGTSPGVAFSVSNGGLNVDCVQLSSILVKGSDPDEAGFDLTTNRGDVYKVWVCDNAEFLSSGCKTDNFNSSETGSGGGGGDPPPTAS